MQARLNGPPTPDETARLVAAVAYATRRAALERKAKAAIRRRDFSAAARLAEECRKLDEAVLG